MSNLNFDLNIYNYTKTELLTILNIENDYTIELLHEKIFDLEKKINCLQLSNKEKTEIFLFLNIIELTLKHDLEKKRMLDTQDSMQIEINLLKEKITKVK